MQRRIVAAVAVILMIVVVAMRWPAHETVQYVLLVGVLAHSSICDLRNRVIPNVDIIVAVFVRVAYFVASVVLGSFSLYELEASLWGGFLVGGLLLALVLAIEYVTGRPGMGGGDIKLYAVSGLYLGLERAVIVVLASCVLGLIAGFALPPERDNGPGADDGESPASSRLQRKMPFGPFIALSLMAVALLSPMF